MKKFISLFLSFLSGLPFTNLNVCAVKEGFWRTDVLVICDNGYRERTEDVVKLMCERECVSRDTDSNEDVGFTNQLLPKQTRSLQAVIHDRTLRGGGKLCVQFHVCELKDLGFSLKSLVKKCAAVIIFYDLENDWRLDELPRDGINAKASDPISAGLNFLLSFDWNNCVEFATYYTDEDEAMRMRNENERNRKVMRYREMLERGPAYARTPGHNNRWGRLHVGVPRFLLNSILSSFNVGIFRPLGDFVKYDNPYNPLELEEMEEGGGVGDVDCCQPSLKKKSCMVA
jgi:hypothetical protein